MGSIRLFCLRAFLQSPLHHTLSVQFVAGSLCRNVLSALDRLHPTLLQNHMRQHRHRDTPSETNITGATTTALHPSLINVSDLISPTLFHTFPTDSWWCQSLWRNDHDSSASLRMEERHSNVVSGNQTIMLSLRICFRCSLTYNDSGRFDWWCRLRHILAGVRVYLCNNQSTPDRIWVLWRPFHIVQPISRLSILASCSWIGSATSSFSMFASSLNRPSYTFCVSSRVPLLAP